VPVPNAEPRHPVSKASPSAPSPGQYDYARRPDLLPVEALSRLEKAAGKTVPNPTPVRFRVFPTSLLNTHQEGRGPPPSRWASKAIRPRIRRRRDGSPAVFGRHALLPSPRGNHFPKGFSYLTTLGRQSPPTSTTSRTATKARPRP